MPVSLLKTQMKTLIKVGTSKDTHVPNQQEKNDLFRDMRQARENAELLTIHLKVWNFLDPNCKVSKYGKRHLSFPHFLPFHNFILRDITKTYLYFLIKLAQIATPRIGDCC